MSDCYHEGMVIIGKIDAKSMQILSLCNIISPFFLSEHNFYVKKSIGKTNDIV